MPPPKGASPLKPKKLRSGASVAGMPPSISAFFPLWRSEGFFQKLPQLGDDFGVHNTHVVDTVRTILTEVSDEKVSLLLQVLQAVLLIISCWIPGQWCLHAPHCTTCVEKGFVMHM